MGRDGGPVSPQLDAEDEVEALAHVKFAALDKDGDGKLSYEEWREMERVRGGMYDGPRFEGEATIPVEDELEKLGRRIEKQKLWRALLLYVAFLACYVGVHVCYPRGVKGDMIQDTTNWILGGQFNGSNSIANVETAADFWAWLDQVVIQSLWTGEHTVMGFNKLVTGVSLAQKRKNFTTECTQVEARLFSSCPRWPYPRSIDMTGLDESIQNLLPSLTPLQQGTRKGLRFQEIPLRNEDGSLMTQKQALAISRGLREENWVDLGTDELITIILFYNPNTELFFLLQVRFLMDETGGIDYDVLTWADVVDTLSDRVRQAGGAPWQLRITLEIIFVVNICLLAVKESYEIVMLVKTRSKEKNKCKGVIRGILNYLSKFWNMIDLMLLISASLVITVQVKSYIKRKKLLDYMTGRMNGIDGLMDTDILMAYFMSVANLDSLFEITNSLCLLIAFFRLFKYMEFHPQLGVVSRTIARARNQLFHFSFVLVTVVIGYTVVAWVMFAPRSAVFRSIPSAIGAIVAMLSTGADYSEFVSFAETQNLSWWGFLPISIFYFGFVFIAALLMLNILLGIVLSTYDELRETMKESPSDDESLLDDLLGGLFHLRKLFGCVKSKVRSSKVDPLCAYLTPADAEVVRPSVDVIFNELSTIHAVLSQPLGSNKVVPYRRIEMNPMKVTFNYADLSQLFSDKVAMYLWAMYGPGAPDVQGSDEDPSKEVLDEAKWKDTKLLAIAYRQEKLEKSIENLGDRLNIVLAALIETGPEERPETIENHQSKDHSDKAENNEDRHEETEELLAPRNSMDVTAELARNTLWQLLSSPKKEQKAQTPLENDNESKRQEISTARKAASSTSSSSLYSSTSSSSLEDLSSDEEEEEANPHDHKPQKESQEIKELPLQAIGQEKKLKKDKRDDLANAFEELMSKLLAETGTCPLQTVKYACRSHDPEISWELAKEKRRGLGIIQCKETIITDGGSRTQVIRVWKRATTPEDFQILQRNMETKKE